MRIAQWNVCSLAAWKAEQQAIESLIARSDFAVLSELRSASIELLASLVPEGGCVYADPGDQFAGGLAVFVHPSLAAVVEPLDWQGVPGAWAVWLRVPASKLDLGGRSLVLGACYFSPEASAKHGVGGVSAAKQRVFGALQRMVRQCEREGSLVILAGDMNARVGGLSDVSSGEELDPQMEAAVGLPAVLEAFGYAQRRCLDRGSNVFGRELAKMCVEHGLLVFNGRVKGDEEGALTYQHAGGRGSSCIDLFVGSSALLATAAELNVSGLQMADAGSRLGRLLSDHHPVELHLKVLREGRSGQPKKRGQAVRFDMQRKDAYAALFAEGMPSVEGVARATAQLDGPVGEGDASCSSVAVERILKVLTRALRQAFAGGQSVRQRLRGVEDAPWWNASCAQARAAMMACERRSAAFRAARRVYHRAKCDAIKAFRLAHFEALVEECQRDPRVLWQRLADKPKECAIANVAVWRSYFDQLLNGSAHAFDPVKADAILSLINGGPWRESAAWRARAETAEQLNEPFTEEEMVAALKCLRNHKSGGLESVPAECYKYAACADEEGRAYNVLAPHLLKLMEFIRSSGDYPRQFAQVALSPIHKKGDVSVPGNYRGIAVGGALAKLYAFMLDRRLSEWAEATGVRSAFQGGFRRGLGTVHNLFVLRHLTDMCRADVKGLHPARCRSLRVCFVDFEKAFDRVPRELLWIRLEERGVHGACLDALKAAYAKVEMHVRVSGVRAEPFVSEQGVKQGCPLSPDLYGMFGEGFADYVAAKDAADPEGMHCADCPVLAGGLPLPLMLYADDLSLFAYSRARLEALLKALQEWCSAFGMRVNAKKCEVLVFSNQGKAEERAIFARESGKSAARTADAIGIGEPFEWRKRVRYLGLHYGPDEPFGEQPELLVAGKKVMLALLSKLRRQALLVPRVALRCFEVQVRSVLSYGAQLWGPDAVLAVLAGDTGHGLSGCFERAMQHPAVQLQREFLWALARVKRCSSRVVFREFKQRPLQYHWAELALRWWNKMVKSKEVIHRAVFLEELRQAHRAQVNPGVCVFGGWGDRMFRMLAALGWEPIGYRPAELPSDRYERLASTLLPVEELLARFAARLDDEWESARLVEADPRVYEGPRPSVAVCKHKCWMGEAAHLGEYIPASFLATLLRFRMCAQELEVNRAAGRPRAERICRMCAAGVVEDEKHFLLECDAYSMLRAAHGIDASDMREVLGGNQYQLASFLHSAARMRLMCLATHAS